MKKILSVIIIAVLMCTCAAMAEETMPIQPDEPVITGIPEGVFPASFTLADFQDDGTLEVTLSWPQIYKSEDISALKVGDEMIYMDAVVTVESIDTDEGLILINGGSEEADGITLWPTEEDSYAALYYESTVYNDIAHFVGAFTDEVNYSHWQEDAEGGIMDEMFEATVPAAEIKDFLTEQGEEEFHCMNTRLNLDENGKITAICVEYHE